MEIEVTRVDVGTKNEGLCLRIRFDREAKASGFVYVVDIASRSNHFLRVGPHESGRLRSIRKQSYNRLAGVPQWLKMNTVSQTGRLEYVADTHMVT